MSHETHTYDVYMDKYSTEAYKNNLNGIYCSTYLPDEAKYFTNEKPKPIDNYLDTHNAFMDNLEKLMDNFDFREVAEMFVTIRFSWVADLVDDGYTVAEIERKLRVMTRRLIKDTISDMLKVLNTGEESRRRETGGICLHAYNNGDLELQAVVSSFETYI